MKKTLILFTALVLLGGCSNNQAVPKTNELSDATPTVATDEPAVVSDQNSDEGISSINIDELERLESGAMDTTGWQSYDSTEYSFKIKYPMNWDVEDFSSAEGQLRLGFYPPDKDRSYEYSGDVTLYTIKRQAGIGVVDYFDMNYLISPSVTENKTVARTDDRKVVVASYDIPGNIDFDVFLVECNEYFIGINVPFGQEREIARLMADQLECD